MATAGADEGAVVQVVSTLPGQSKYGTGFCFNREDQFVATCYHCIAGARKIEVVNGSKIYSSDLPDANRVEIVWVDPDRDLAVLRVFGSTLKALHVAGDLSAIEKLLRTDVDVKVKGYPHGMGQLQFSGKLVADGLMSAKQLRDLKGKPLFPSSSAQIIPCDITTGAGGSGAPLLVGEDVVGVLSGSLDTGFTRSLAWAVPMAEVMKPSKAKELSIISGNPQSVTDWPPVNEIGSYKASKALSVTKQPKEQKESFEGVWENLAEHERYPLEYRTLLSLSMFDEGDPRYKAGKLPEEAAEEAKTKGYSYAMTYSVGAHGWFDYHRWERSTESGATQTWSEVEHRSGFIFLRAARWMSGYEKDKSVPIYPNKPFQLVIESDGTLRLNRTQSVWSSAAISDKDVVFTRLHE